MSATNQHARAGDPEEVRTWVRHALLRLSDPSRLQRNPLANDLGAKNWRDPMAGGRLLRVRLLESIEALRPPASAPEASHAWRSYQLLHLRYVSECDVVTVCSKLGISKSEYHRDHRVALAAVTADLLAASQPSRGVGSLADRLDDSAATFTNSMPAIASCHTPAPLGRLVGRETELAQICRLLGPGAKGSRLLTVTGAPGVGKTRLALEGAVRLRGCFRSIWNASLDEQTAPAGAHRRVAQVLDQSARQVLARGEGENLLLLDGCDVDIDGCAQAVASLLRQHPTWRVLATGRRSLHVPGERSLRLLPLAVPDPEQSSDPTILRHNPSVQLLLEHAVAADPDFRLRRENAPVVARLAQQLAGLPLAIELAAVRLRSSTAEELARDLDDPLAILRNEQRVGPARHRSLEALLDSSYDRLSLAQQAVFERLAVFDGGWTREAAAAVLTPGRRDSRLLADLAALVDHGLVLADTSDVDTSFQFPSLVRCYALRRLTQKANQESLRRRHAAVFLGLAEAAELKLTGPEQAPWLRRLERDLDNIRAALCLFQERGETESGLRLASALWFFWHLHGRDAEGRDWLRRFLALPFTVAPTIERAKALYAAAYLNLWLGDHATARELATESRRHCDSLHDQRGAAYATHVLALVARNEHDHVAERSYFQESVRLLEAVGDRWRAAWSLTHLAGTAFREGDYGTARTLHQQNLVTRLQLSDRHGVAGSLTGLADVCRAEGDIATADALYREALAIHRELGDSDALAYIHTALAHVALLANDMASAETSLHESLLLRVKKGDDVRVAGVLTDLANVAEARGQPARAARLRVLATAMGRPVVQRESTERAMNGHARWASGGELASLLGPTIIGGRRSPALDLVIREALGRQPVLMR